MVRTQSENVSLTENRKTLMCLRACVCEFGNEYKKLCEIEAYFKEIKSDEPKRRM